MSKRYRGGILLTTLLFVFLFSYIFMIVLEDFQLTQQFTKKTKDYYIAKTMVSMFLSDIKQENKSLEKEGQQSFSNGLLHYEYDQKLVRFIVQVNQTTYKFYEEYRKEKKEEIKTSDESG